MQETIQVIQRKKDSILHFVSRKKTPSGFMKNHFAGYSYRTHYRCHICSVWINKMNCTNSVKIGARGILFHTTCGKRLRNCPRRTREHVYID